MDAVPFHVRVNGSFNEARICPTRSGVLVGVQVISGTYYDGILLRSELYGDLWRAGDVVFFGAGPPTEYDRENSGKRRLHFVALVNGRDIEEGEEFTQVDEVPKK